MSTPFIGQISSFAFNFPPKGWAFCNGQLLPINQNQALFSLLGTTYGGNGQTTFALPNLQGCVPIMAGNGYTLGQTGGEQNHTVILSELASHGHPLSGSSSVASQTTAPGNYPAAQTSDPYSTAAVNNTLGTGTNSIGGGQPHSNMQPFLTIIFCISLQGIFPSRS